MKRLFFAFAMLALSASLLPVSITAQENSLDKVFCYRESGRDGSSVKVQILVNLKGLSKGKTVKIKEKIPAGFKGKIVDGYGSVTDVSETTVSFIWNKLPLSDLFIIKYELIYPGPVNENVNISGNMSYMSEFGIKYVSVVEKGFMTDKDLNYAIKNIPAYKPAPVESEEDVTTASTTKTQPVVVTSGTTIPEDAPKPKPRTEVTETKTEVKPVETKTEVTPVKTEVKPVAETKTEVKPVETKTEVTPVKTEVKPVAETKTEVTPVKTEVKPVAETKTEVKPVTSGGTIATASGVFYSVQIGASADKLPTNHFDKYKFDMPVEENAENGMYKYLLGRFPTLKEANAYLAKVKTKGVACFVVAYNNGKRCTVKEALDITGK